VHKRKQQQNEDIRMKRYNLITGPTNRHDKARMKRVEKGVTEINHVTNSEKKRREGGTEGMGNREGKQKLGREVCHKPVPKTVFIKLLL
jgi:hypothetical protein